MPFGKKRELPKDPKEIISTVTVERKGWWWEVRTRRDGIVKEVRRERLPAEEPEPVACIPEWARLVNEWHRNYCGGG